MKEWCPDYPENPSPTPLNPTKKKSSPISEEIPGIKYKGFKIKIRERQNSDRVAVTTVEMSLKK
jgi:hypothetical protein